MSLKINKKSPLSRLMGFGAIIGAALLTTSPARAAFHLWNIREIYSNSSGSAQFIELFTTSSNQQFVNGQPIQVTFIGGMMVNTFTIPTNLPSNSANKSFLLGTAGLQVLGGPAPDYIIPDNFLSTGGGSISFFGQNSGSYTALPTDGTMSRNWSTGANNGVNSPTNFAGQAGVVVPEPTSVTLGAMALGLLTMSRRRQQRKSVAGSV